MPWPNFATANDKADLSAGLFSTITSNRLTP
jgi:hypothetical protein